MSDETSVIEEETPAKVYLMTESTPPPNRPESGNEVDVSGWSEAKIATFVSQGRLIEKA